MTTEIAMSQAVQSAEQAVPESASERLPASPGSVERFEQMMFQPDAAGMVAGSQATDPGALIDKLRAHATELSAQSANNEALMKKLAGQNGSEMTTAELTQLNLRLASSMVNVEVASKTAGSVDNGIRTLMNQQ